MNKLEFSSTEDPDISILQCQDCSSTDYILIQNVISNLGEVQIIVKKAKCCDCGLVVSLEPLGEEDGNLGS